MIFGKVPKGAGIIFNPKIYNADFGDFKQGFLSMKLIQKALMPLCIYAPISIIKKMQYDFPKMRGGQKSFGIFPKNHPIW